MYYYISLTIDHCSSSQRSNVCLATTSPCILNCYYYIHDVHQLLQKNIKRYVHQVKLPVLYATGSPKLWTAPDPKRDLFSEASNCISIRGVRVPDKFGYPMFGSGRVPVGSGFSCPRNNRVLEMIGYPAATSDTRRGFGYPNQSGMRRNSGIRCDRVPVATFGTFLGWLTKWKNFENSCPRKICKVPLLR